MAHVRVAVVHHLQVRCGIRPQQRAGRASVPLVAEASWLVEESVTLPAHR